MRLTIVLLCSFATMFVDPQLEEHDPEQQCGDKQCHANLSGIPILEFCLEAIPNILSSVLAFFCACLTQISIMMNSLNGITCAFFFALAVALLVGLHVMRAALIAVCSAMLDANRHTECPFAIQVTYKIGVSFLKTVVSSNTTLDEFTLQIIGSFSRAFHRQPRADAISIELSCNGRTLRGGGRTLSEICPSPNSVVHVRVLLAGGGRDECRSNTRKGLEALLHDLAKEAKKTKHGRRLTDNGNTMTSHILRAIFRNKEEGKEVDLVPGNVPFHPKDWFPCHYSPLQPMVVITYTWSMCLLTELPSFLDVIEREVRRETGMEPTYWFDIWHNDQNAVDIQSELDAAEWTYKNAKYHYALMLNNPFSRGWCCFELMVRILAAMAALGLREGEDIVRLIQPFMQDRNPCLTRLVIVDEFTDIDRDVTGSWDERSDVRSETWYDRFGLLTTYDPGDLVKIKRRILEACGSPYGFNRLMSAIRATALQEFFQVRDYGQILSRAVSQANRGS